MSSRRLLPGLLVAATALLLPPPARAEEGRVKEPDVPGHFLEVTFGASQVWSVPNAAVGRVKARLPTSSVLLLAEWLAIERLGVVVLANIPLTTQRAIVTTGEVVEEFAAPALMGGVRFSPLAFDVRGKTHIELQVAGFLGSTVRSETANVVFPMLAGRIHLSRSDGFTLYLGGSFAFRKDTAAILYGVGHRF